MAKPPTNSSRLALKIAALLTSAGAATLGGLGAVVFAQARRVVSRPGEAEVGFWIDGHIGPVNEEPRRIVWIGDSLAAGLGAAAAEVSLPHFVARGSAHPTRLHSFATSGATSSDVVAHQLPALEQLRHGLGQLGQRIDAIGVTVGANDIAAFTPRRRFRRNLKEIVLAAEGTPVTFVSIPQLGDAIRLPHPLRALATMRASWLDRALRDLAERHGHVHYASVRRRPEWIRRADRANYLAADRFHPSGAGYAVWADRVAEAFENALRPAVDPA